MSPTLKRALLIALLLLVAGLIGFALYIAFQKTTQPTRPETGEVSTGQPSQLPSAGERVPGTEGPATGAVSSLPTASSLPTITSPSYYQPEAVTKITSDFALFPSSNAAGNLRYHNGSDGKFYHVAADGSIKPLSDQVFFNVQEVTWAAAKDKAVITYPDNSKILYDFDLKKQVSLPKHWQDFSFSPEASQVAAKSIGLSPDNRWLVTTRDDGTGTRLIEPLGENADKVTVNWSPSRQTVAFSQTGQPQGIDQREILFLGLNGENFKSTVVEGLDFEPQWSPTGQQLLYSVDSARSDFKPELWVVDAYGETIGGNRHSLSINTWAHKCAFGGEGSLFCAVPRDLPQGAGMSPAVAADNYDDLYKIDLKTGLKTPVPLDQDYTVDTISYNKTNNKLFFTDHHQSGAFAVNL